MLFRSVESESESAPDAIPLMWLLTQRQHVVQAHRSCRTNMRSGANVK